MILIGIGSNLPSPKYGQSRAVCEAALVALGEAGLRIAVRSRWYESAPVPATDQPWYVNGVAWVDTELGPEPLLQVLHRIEADFGRVRTTLNAARILDLDLLAYDDRIIHGEGGVILPHPRLAERAFVLLPLADIAPSWRHPASGRSISELISSLPGDWTARPLQGGNAGESF